MITLLGGNTTYFYIACIGFNFKRDSKVSQCHYRSMYQYSFKGIESNLLSLAVSPRDCFPKKLVELGSNIGNVRDKTRVIIAHA